MFNQFRKANSLIEMLVSISIIATLIAILLPAVQMVRNTALKMDCRSKMRNIGIASHNYYSVMEHFPSGCDSAGEPKRTSSSYGFGISWHTQLLPYLEQPDLYEKAMHAYKIDIWGSYDEQHLQIASTILPIFLCPSESRRSARLYNGIRWALTSYVGMMGTSFFHRDGMLVPIYPVSFAEVNDGLSNTIFVGERPPGPLVLNSWYSFGYSPCELSQLLPLTFPPTYVGCRNLPVGFAKGDILDECSSTRFWSLHSGGANFLFADGSVRFLQYSAAPLLPALATRNGGEIVTLD